MSGSKLMKRMGESTNSEVEGNEMKLRERAQGSFMTGKNQSFARRGLVCLPIEIAVVVK